VKLRLLGGPVEDFRCIPIDVPPEEQAKQKCWRCGNEFDLRRANATEWICGECIAIYRGGQEALDAYIASHPRHYGRKTA
jgi:ribosomal protein L37AE/L43A